MSSTTSNAPDERQLALLQASARGNETRVRALLTETLWHTRMDQTALRHSLQQVAARGNLSLARFLIEKGADVNPQAGEVGALIKAIGTGNNPLIRSILDAPGQNINVDTRDKAGRTALYTAAWSGNVAAVKMLLGKRAKVDARDREDRTPLIHLAAEKQGRWQTDMIELLLESGADIEAIDNTRRTSLLWGASTGKSELCRLLLQGKNGIKADVRTTNNRGKTPLQLAAENNHEAIVGMLLEAGADPQVTSDGQWTALHNAAEKGHVGVVKLLLDTWADVNAETSSGMTPLHWAAQNGHREVVELIMQKPGVMLSNKDTFNSTPLLRAAERGHMDIVHMLSPYNQAHRLPEAAKKACQGFDCTIVDFGITGSQKNADHQKGQLVYKHSVHDLLYGWDSKADRPLVPTLAKNVKSKPAFRWIHLPANNIAWIETLLTKSFIEGGARDVDDFKALEKCFGQEHRGPTVHAHFMRTFCQRMGISIMSAKHGGPIDSLGPPAPPLEGHATAPPSKVPELGPSIQKENETPRKAATAALKDTPTKAEKKKAKKEKQGRDNAQKGDGGGSNGTKGGKLPKPAPNVRSESWHPEGRHGKIVLFVSLIAGLWREQANASQMPYLHYESDDRRVRMSKVIHENGSRDFQPIESSHDAPDECMVEAYLNSPPQLHIRRTLDQFFYHGIDTSQRDSDQVVWRYCRKMKMEKKVFMVDQLWCWILGKDLIVTSFPQRWDQPKNDPLNVLDGIIEDINSKTRAPVKSVHDLAMLITGRCSGVFDRHRLGHEEFQFLDMFDNSIGHVTERETKLFDRFNRASLQAAQWLRHHRRKRHGRQSSDSARAGTSSFDDGRLNNILFVDALLDIIVETELLAEIKDIRDELQMIEKVLKEQKSVIPELADRLSDDMGGRRSTSSIDVHKRNKEQIKIIETHLTDVDRMDKQAEGIYRSLTHLLDLKQKHANAFEARFARDQAELAARQGQTIMVFTIVTIVFLPLSFMAAFFTINIDEFPKDGNGGTGLHLGWVAKYMFGIGLAISIPLIAVAFSVGDIVDFWRGLRSRWAQHSHRKRLLKGNTDTFPEREDLVTGRTSRASHRRRRRSDANATGTDTEHEKMNGRLNVHSPSGRKSEGLYSNERGLSGGMSPDFEPPMRTWSRRTEFSWRLDMRGRPSRDSDRFGTMV